MTEQILTTNPDSEADTSFDPEELEPIDGNELLEKITQFIGRYLRCSEHQRTVLALWVLHTHALPAAQVTPYLTIQSLEKQSGKTLCLQLLNLLCQCPALTAGFTVNAVTRRIDGPISTILLDECQATVGTRARSKGPALRAILASSFHCGVGYTDPTHERSVFAPKAFAGMGQLPEALADRSIPIILEPLKPPSTTKPKVQRFDLRRAHKEAKPLQEQLHAWADENDSELEELSVYSEEAFPPNLSPRRCDIIEPLLQLADFIGGVWPARIREAFAGIFKAETALELRHSLLLLADIRDCFVQHDYPERLSTAGLLEWMHALPNRPWDADGPITARTLARLLLAFDVHPRVQRIGPGDTPGSPTRGEGPARGYQLKDFIEPWQTQLGFSVPDSDRRSAFVSSDEPMTRRPDDPIDRATTHNGEDVTYGVESKTASENAACNAVTDAGAVSASNMENSVMAAKLNGKDQNLVEDFPDGLPIPPQTVSENGIHNTVVSA